MPKYVIERTLSGAGRLSQKELGEVASKSNAVLRELGSDIQWLESFVTDDKLYCVYRATSAELVRKHAQIGGFPLDSVSEVRSVIEPTTGE